MGDKIGTFCSSKQLVWVRLRGSEGGTPTAWLYYFKHILIQIFA